MKKISATILAVVSGWVASGRPENSASYSVNAQQNKVELDVYAAGPAQAELLARLTAGCYRFGSSQRQVSNP